MLVSSSPGLRPSASLRQLTFFHQKSLFGAEEGFLVFFLPPVQSVASHNLLDAGLGQLQLRSFDLSLRQVCEPGVRYLRVQSIDFEISGLAVRPSLHLALVTGLKRCMDQLSGL